LFRAGLRGWARDWNWHQVAGVWCALPLLLITLTGVVISCPWANALLFRLAGSAPPAGQGAGRPPQRESAALAQGTPQPLAADLDRAVAVARATLTDWRSLSLRIPGSADVTVVVTGGAGAGCEVKKRTALASTCARGRSLA
jgi:uncharacterized iron-regulated membrane protein